MENRKYQNFAYVKGEVRSLELGDQGDRKNVKVRVNLHVDGNFIDVQFTTPRKADTNWAEKLHNRLVKGDKIEVKGNLDEFFYNDEYRRSIRPFVSTKNGYSNCITIHSNETELEETATAKLSGDILQIEDDMSSGEQQKHVKMLVFSTFNPGEDRDKTIKEVLVDELSNFAEYKKDNPDKEVDLKEVEDAISRVAGIEEDDIKELLKAYKIVKKKWNPLFWNINEFNLTAQGDQLLDVEELDEYDNVLFGCHIRNEVRIDEFGISDGSISMLEIGRTVINDKYESDGLDSWE